MSLDLEIVRPREINLYPNVYAQVAEPALQAGEFAIWHDTTPGDEHIYMGYERNGEQYWVEMTAV